MFFSAETQVADENTNPAVTSLAAAAAVDGDEENDDDDASQPLIEASSCPDHAQTSAIINRSINLLPPI